MKHCSTCPGFTLVELLVALSITALVAAGAMGMLFAMSKGTANDLAARQDVLQAAVLRNRLNTAIRSTTTLLASGSDYLVLWKGDTYNDGQVHVSGLRRIDYSPTTSQVCIYEAFSGVNAASDTAYPISGTDFNALTNSLISSGRLQTRVAASQVSAAAFTPVTATTGTEIDYAITLSSPATVVVGGDSLRILH